MGFYEARITTDGSGNGTNDTLGRYTWNGNFTGLLMGIRIDDNGAAATVDITLKENKGLMRTIFTATDLTSDTTYNPQWEIQNSTGTATGLYAPLLVDSTNLEVEVAQGGTSVTEAIIVTVLILEL